MAYDGDRACNRHRVYLKAVPFRLQPGTTVRQGFAVIMRGGLDHLNNNQVAALNGGGIECVHQMRVALRQISATLALFRDVIASPDLTKIKRDLKWFSCRLGAARDWDVFETKTLLKLKHAPKTRGAAERIIKVARDERLVADRCAIRALRSARYGRFIRTVARWIAEERWCDHLDPELHSVLDQPLVEAGRPWLHRSAHRARKDARGIAHLKAKQRHRLRIALKQLRYDTDALSSLYAQGKVKPYVVALRTLQNVLGGLNDLAVARQLMRGLTGGDGETVDEKLKAAKVKRLKTLVPAWHSFRIIAPFWKRHRMSTECPQAQPEI